MKNHKVLRIVVRVLIIVAIVAAVLAAAWGLYYTHRSSSSEVVKYETTNPSITGNTICIAHRSGSGVAPEETMAAFKVCTQRTDLDIGFLEFDLHLTADNQLVLLHDKDLDRTSDSVEVFGQTGTTARSKTLAELKQLNMGAQFVAEDGSTPYAGLSGSDVPNDVRIATLDEALDYLGQQGKGAYHFVIEIKDSGDDGKMATDLLVADLNRRGISNNVILGTFHDEIASYFDEKYPDLARAAGNNETVDFYIAAMTNRANYNPPFDALVLPYGNLEDCYGLNTGLANVVNYAHDHNLFVSYWTINTADQMKYLASIGADAIITDYPDIFVEALR